MPNSNQQSPQSLAKPPEQARLTRDIQDLARRLTQSVPDLTRQERQFLWDQMRRPGHRMNSVYRMAAIALRSTSEVDRAALKSFAARLFSPQRRAAGVAIVSAEIEETKSRAALNLAEIERHVHDDAITREQEEYFARIEIENCERVIDSLYAGGAR